MAAHRPEPRSLKRGPFELRELTWNIQFLTPAACQVLRNHSVRRLSRRPSLGSTIRGTRRCRGRAPHTHTPAVMSCVAPQQRGASPARPEAGQAYETGVLAPARQSGLTPYQALTPSPLQIPGRVGERACILLTFAWSPPPSFLTWLPAEPLGPSSAQAPPPG